MDFLKNWKTSVTVIVGIIASILNKLLGMEIPQEAIITVMIFLIGLLTKDADKTGTTKAPRTDVKTE